MHAVTATSMYIGYKSVHIILLTKLTGTGSAGVIQFTLVLDDVIVHISDEVVQFSNNLTPVTSIMEVPLMPGFPRGPMVPLIPGSPIGPSGPGSPIGPINPWGPCGP